MNVVTQHREQNTDDLFGLIDEVIVRVYGGICALQPQKLPDLARCDDALEWLNRLASSCVEDLRGHQFCKALWDASGYVFLLCFHHRDHWCLYIDCTRGKGEEEIAKPGQSALDIHIELHTGEETRLIAPHLVDGRKDWCIVPIE